MIKVLFVCTGNICRSPTAEGIFTNLVKNEKLADKFFIDSAGTHEYHIGKSPDQRSQKTAKENGIDISMLRARQVEREDFLEFDHILAMDKFNLECLKAIAPGGKMENVSLMLSYTKQDLKEVPDPYYNDDGFQKVFDLLDSSAKSFLEKLTSAKDLQ